MKYYSLKNILSKKAHYNVIIGERSNGKTYSVLEHGIKEYFEHGGELAIIRRWREDFRGKRGESLFNSHVQNGVVSKYSNGRFNDIFYYAGRWYFANTVTDENGRTETTREVKPFAYSYALTEMEHDKGTSEPNITTVLFDEFLTRKNYLPDEFIIFQNTLSTIIRLRSNVTIFMCGNTVNIYSPYYSEMGLTHIKNMKQGDIEVYTYGESDLRVAVEFSDSPSKKKPSDLYFAFNNPKLNMITGKNGSVWEMNIYPHSPIKFLPKNIQFIFFILFDGHILQCEVVQVDLSRFIFIHQKTTELKNEDKDLIYCLDYDPRPNWRRKINKPFLDIEKKIYSLFAQDKVFYQDNTVGEIVRNYLKCCGESVLK